jgi:hypothetical protein
MPQHFPSWQKSADAHWLFERSVEGVHAPPSGTLQRDPSQTSPLQQSASVEHRTSTSVEPMQQRPPEHDSCPQHSAFVVQAC